MNSRHAQYLGVAILAGSVLLAALQVPALVWLVAIAIAVITGTVVMTGRERGTVAAMTSKGAAGSDAVTTTDVAEVADPPTMAEVVDPPTMAEVVDPPTMAEVADPPTMAEVVDPPTMAEVVDPPTVAVEAVGVADGVTGAQAVWLHRSGGRRVHRFADGDAWTVQQVSTKDPDNPKKRIIGEPLTYTSEDEAIKAADNLAQGILPRDVDAARQYGVPPVAMAEARRRKVQLKGRAQARRLAAEWGVSAGA